MPNTSLSPGQRQELLKTIKARFDANMNRHRSRTWPDVLARLEAHTEKLWSLREMERTGGQPDVVEFNNQTGEYMFADCSPESPPGRRNMCYDRAGQVARKSGKPEGNALDMSGAMGIELLTEELYRQLQGFGAFDTKTSSWIRTPSDIRTLGGALFADRRYGTVFIYHNSAPSFYSSRGFRGSLRI